MIEKQRSFDVRTRAVQVVLEDDFGVEHLLQAHVGVERCPMCQHEYPKNLQGTPDLNQLVADMIVSLDQEADTVIRAFEQCGADMSAAKATLDARRSQASAVGGSTPTPGGT